MLQGVLYINDTLTESNSSAKPLGIGSAVIYTLQCLFPDLERQT